MAGSLSFKPLTPGQHETFISGNVPETTIRQRSPSNRATSGLLRGKGEKSRGVCTQGFRTVTEVG
jgi:hypothetical protein